MRFAEPLNDGRTSYSVPKQEVRGARCFTTLKIKRTIYESICDSALRGLRGELAHHLYENNASVPMSTENYTSGNWVALAMPETIPSRLSLMTRIASLMTWQSDPDNIFALSRPASNTFNQLAQDLAEALPGLANQKQTFARHNDNLAKNKTRSAIVNNLVKPVLGGLVTTDRSQGLEVLDAWRDYQRGLATDSATTCITECIGDEPQTCIRVFPGKAWMTTLRYALGLHLKKSELEALEPAIEAAMQSVALTRDYWSWPQDSRSAVNNKRVTNAVAITMAERDCSEEMAMAAVKNAAMTAENRFLQRKLELLEVYGKGHSEAVMFLDAVEHFAAGNSLWCSTCPLYHGRR